MASYLTTQTEVCAALAIASVPMSAVLVRGVMGYAHHRGMLDLPGQRRSHDRPTVRGGGLGLILAMAVCSFPALLWSPAVMPVSRLVAFMLALALVAGIGWRDDQRPLSAIVRILVQCVAVVLFSLAVLLTGQLSLWWLPMFLIVGVGSVNAHNFMDGIDALLTLQSMFMGIALAALAWLSHAPGLAWACLCMAGASLGFLFFNRPPARIFMGDVGSGALGLAIFMFIALLSAADTSRVWSMLVLTSGFAIDSGLTLLSRMLKGRRWYAAHREHTYQWLVRAGCSHARVGWLYMTWNVLIVPVAWMAWSDRGLGAVLCAGVYMTGAIVWGLARVWALQTVRRRASPTGRFS